MMMMMMMPALQKVLFYFIYFIEFEIYLFSRCSVLFLFSQPSLFSVNIVKKNPKCHCFFFGSDDDDDGDSKGIFIHHTMNYIYTIHGSRCGAFWYYSK